MEIPHTPFLGAREVRRGCLSRRQLSTQCQQVLPGVYLPNTVQLDAVRRAESAWVWAKGRAVLAGRSAAAIWGVTGIPPDAQPAIATAAHLRPPPGLDMYRTAIADDEQTEWLSFRLTTPARTAFEIGRRLPFVEALPLVEQLYCRTGLTPDEVANLALRYPRIRGAGQLRALLDASRTGILTPFQSRTRAELLRARLPPPETMIVVNDQRGRNAGLAHIAWRQFQVAVQCFETSSLAEFENLNTLVHHGWLVLAVRSCPDQNPAQEFGAYLSHRVKTALQARGAFRVPGGTF